ncbi:MAG: hypothetical protein QM767_02095 [Anaeromyxobacter sp.]
MTTFLRTAAALAALATALPALADRPAARQVRQQERIGQGVQSGELTRHEALRLERQEARLHRGIVRDRVDGGGLSPAERAKNRAPAGPDERPIHAQKHDAQVR